MSAPRTLPPPRRPEPRSVPALRWAVMGTGWVARRFTDSLHRYTDQRVVAVGSREAGVAVRFAAEHGIDRAHGSYEALAADPGVDVVYVALPHQLHRPAAELAIGAGRHVLVEKPLALDVADATAVYAAASAASVGCFEAHWTAFLPRTDVVRQVVAAGWLGELRTVLGDHGERFDPAHRIWDPAMAGGALLDLGTYLTSFALEVLGPVQSLQAQGQLTATGVVGESAAVLTHAGGALSVLHTSMVTTTPTAASLAGTEGLLSLPAPFFMPGDVVLSSPTGQEIATWREPEPVRHAGLYHSAIEVAFRLGRGELDTPWRSQEAVLANLAVLDAWAAAIGAHRGARGAEGASHAG
ncbi:Gfo/Idh/MocA family protein [Kineococcus sp. SYSU DK003]|uniref:Gfo/Idh/MocA family protein n=1 Tax=Kineococcus sp. SYSU DK003 TaxID=3383124 RepID=UPI003D7DD049